MKTTMTNELPAEIMGNPAQRKNSKKVGKDV